MVGVPLDDVRTARVIGAAIEVHRELGPGFLERVYKVCLAKELERKSVPFAMEVELPIRYKGEAIGCTYRADIICFGDLLVELKALPVLSGQEQAQVINYLRAASLPLGLLLNFGTPTLTVRRCIGPTHFEPRSGQGENPDS